MSLSTHEIFLLLRARDEATRVISSAIGGVESNILQLGRTVATAGIASASIGAGLVYGLDKASQSLEKYETDSRRTLTQVDQKAGLTLKNIEDMGLNVAKTVPVAFDQIQGSLYDVFSSIDVNGPEAQSMLISIGKAAIGGATDMETAGDSIIGMMNAWGKETMSAEHANNVMFQTVKLGRGTYEEFTAAMGKSIPSALRASQSAEQLSAMLAFMTRNGMTAAMAGTSAARAMDAMANPNVEKNLKKIGVSVFDASGNFKDMSVIMAELKPKFEGLTEEQQTAKLKEVFALGGNNVQALRFFNQVLNDTTGLYPSLVERMVDSGTAAEDAYNIMKNTPEAKIQSLKNEFELMAIGIGETVMPIKMAIVDNIKLAVEWFNKLDPEVKKNITTFVMIAAAILLIGGIIAIVVGGFMMLASVIGAVAGPVAIVTAVILAVGAAAYYIIQNFEALKAKALEIWAPIQKEIEPVIETLQELWNKHIPTLQRIFTEMWDKISKAATDAWNELQPSIKGIQDALTGIGPAISNFLQVANVFFTSFVGQLQIIWSTVGGVITGIVTLIGGVVKSITDIVTGFINVFKGIFTGDFTLTMEGIKQIFQGTFELVWSIIAGFVSIVYNAIKGFVEGVINFFKYLYDVLVGHSIIPDLVNSIVKWFSDMVDGVVKWVNDLVQKLIDGWNGIVKNVTDAWNLVWSTISMYWNMIIEYIKKVISDIISSITTWLNDTGSKIKSGWDNIVSTVKTAWDNMISSISGFITDIINKINNWISDAKSKISDGWDAIKNKVKEAWDGIVKGVTTGINDLVTKVKEIPNKVVDGIGDMASRTNSLGRSIVQGLINGIGDMLTNLTNAARNIATQAYNAAQSALQINSPSRIFRNLGRGVGEGLILGIQDMFGAVASVGRDLGDLVTDSVNPDISIGNTALSAGFSNDYGRNQNTGKTVNNYVDVTVNTKELDPIKQSADLGFELTSRLG